MKSIKDVIRERMDMRLQNYKDQLAAIDLLLLEPEETKAAWNLYLTCGKHGLVKTFTANEQED